MANLDEIKIIELEEESLSSNEAEIPPEFLNSLNLTYDQTLTRQDRLKILGSCSPPVSNIDSEFDKLFSKSEENKKEAIIHIKTKTLRKLIDYSLELVSENYSGKFNAIKNDMKQSRIKKSKKNNKSNKTNDNKIDTRDLNKRYQTLDAITKLETIIQRDLIRKEKVGELVLDETNPDSKPLPIYNFELAAKLNNKHLYLLWHVLDQNWKGAKLPNVSDLIY